MSRLRAADAHWSVIKHQGFNTFMHNFNSERLFMAPSEALAAEATQVLVGWLDDKGKHAGEADDLPCREPLALLTKHRATLR